MDTDPAVFFLATSCVGMLVVVAVLVIIATKPWKKPKVSKKEGWQSWNR